jgi:uncharacterized protein (TIGR02453 family)
MFSQSTLDFLKDLKAHNEKEWFHDNKKRYQSARSEFIEVVGTLVEGISGFDKEFAKGEVDAKKSIMRINRDIRFSKDKTPYKTNLFSYLCKGGKKSPYAGYYFNLEPESSFFGAGIYMPESPVLAKIRQEIDYNPEEWTAIVQDKNLVDEFGEIQPSGKLSRPPKGYDKENPMVDWLKFKGYYLQSFLSDQDILEKSVKEIVDRLQNGHALIAFINRGIVPVS